MIKLLSLVESDLSLIRIEDTLSPKAVPVALPN